MMAIKKSMLIAAFVLMTATLGSGIAFFAAGSDAWRFAKRQAVGAPGEGQEQPGRRNGNAPPKTKPAEKPVEPETALADLPGLKFDGSYRVDPFIRAAVALQKMGKEKACEKMLELAAVPKRENRVIVLCRMLFKGNPAGERRRFFGMPFLLARTSENDWPLEPIELVDGVPFLIATGYGWKDLPPPPKHYLQYCIKECAWNDFAFKAKDPKEKQAALDKLLASPKWKVPLSDFEKKFLAEQIKAKTEAKDVDPAKGPAVPDISESVAPANSYKVDPFIQAAVAYQAMGQEKACEKLRELAADPRCGGRVIVPSESHSLNASTNAFSFAKPPNSEAKAFTFKIVFTASVLPVVVATLATICRTFR